MRAAAEIIIGKHDFKSFAATRQLRDGIQRADADALPTFKKVRKTFTFIIEGDGFLLQMCRGIVGTLVRSGRGRFRWRRSKPS